MFVERACRRCCLLAALTVLCVVDGTSDDSDAPKSATELGCYGLVHTGDHVQQTTAPTIRECLIDCTSRYYRYAGISSVSICRCHSVLGPKQSVESCDGTDMDIVYDTGVRVAGPPTDVTLVNLTESSVHVSWSPPVLHHATVLHYELSTRVLHTYSGRELYKRTNQWTFSNNTFSGVIGELQPATKYNLSVRAVSGERHTDPAAHVQFETEISVPDVPPAPPQIVDRLGSTLTVRLSPVTSNNNGPVTAYQVVVVRLDQMQLFDMELLEPYHEAQADGLAYYIAARLPVQDVTPGTIFTVGDGKNYGGYYNAPLYEAVQYNVLLGVVSSSAQLTKNARIPTRIRYNEINETSDLIIVQTDDKESPLVVALSIAIILSLVLLLIAAVTLAVVRRRYRRGRRQRLSDNQELSIQGPMVHLSNNGYIPDEELEQVCHYDRLKKMVLRIDRNDLQLDEGQILGFGKFGHVLAGQVKCGQSKVRPVQVFVVTDGDMSTEQKRTMLRELDSLIRAGQHTNIAGLVGTCETYDTVFVACQCGEVSLKQFLLDNRSRMSELRPQTFAPTLTGCQVLELAAGIANGMCHLAQSSVPHGRLCARNVFVSDGRTALVTGFGLSNFNRNNVPLDLTRWKAPEQMVAGRQPSVHGDVWSFGCCLWEMCSMGGTPYGDMDSQTVRYEVNRGFRLPQASQIEDQLYQMMLQCWQTDPGERPTFPDIIQQIDYFRSTNSTLSHLSFKAYGDPDHLIFAKFSPEMEVQEEHVVRQHT